MASESFIEEEADRSNIINALDIETKSETENETKKQNSHPFHWVNMLIMYTPMITPYTIQNGKIKKHDDIKYKICLILLILLVIAWTVWYAVDETIDGPFTLYHAVYLASFTCHTVAKFLSIYYFWKYFQFYTFDSSDNASRSGVALEANHKLSKRISMRMKVILSIVICCYLTMQIIRLSQLIQSEDTKAMDWICFTRRFITYYVFDVPLFLTQFVLSITYFEGHLFITNLHHVIDESIKSKQMVFGSAVGEYHSYRHEYKEKIKLLEYYIKCRLLSQILFVWVSITGVVEADTFLSALVPALYLILDALPFIEMVLAGSLATTSFHKFKKKIYSIGIDIIDESRNHGEYNLYLYLLQYVTKYPFLIKIFAKEVSIKNFIKVCAAFAAAKVATYLLKIHVV